MVGNRQQISAAFAPYLREFLERAKAEKPELAQVEIPAELQSAVKSLGVSFKTSFGMGSPAVIPWLGCFLPGQTAGKHGVYPVLLYRRDTKTLSVCYGVSANAQVADGLWPRVWPEKMVSGLKQLSGSLSCFFVA